jgi:hypothetical protein
MAVASAEVKLQVPVAGQTEPPFIEVKPVLVKVKSKKTGAEFEVLCRQICVDRTTYSFIQHNHLEKGLRSDLLIGLVMFVDNEKPVEYLFPSTVWQTPNQLFTNSAVNHAEYGISVNRKTFAELSEYTFEKQVLNY